MPWSSGWVICKMEEGLEQFSKPRKQLKRQWESTLLRGERTWARVGEVVLLQYFLTGSKRNLSEYRSPKMESAGPS
jgi:hypothetical protein